MMNRYAVFLAAFVLCLGMTYALPWGMAGSACNSKCTGKLGHCDLWCSIIHRQTGPKTACQSDCAMKFIDCYRGCY